LWFSKLIFQGINLLQLFKFFLAEWFTGYQHIIPYLDLKQLVAFPAAAWSLVAVIDKRELAFRVALGTHH
jgi:hypothetical protein